MIINTNDGRGLIPIEEGGTGASTAEQALSNLGGMSMGLLWENASPISEFSAQTLTLDLTNYDGIKIVLAAWGGVLIVIDCVKSSNGLTYVAFSRALNVGYTQFVSRAITIYEDKVTFANATRENGSSSNKNLIPVRIYGFKGVQ